MVLPFLGERHEVTVFDLKPPTLAAPFIEGNVRDFLALRAACEGQDALLYMAMGAIAGWGEPQNALAHFDANVTGLHLALRAAGEAGIEKVVHISSMSVYDQLAQRYIPDEDQPCDASEFYGLSKRLGEEVCRAACREHALSVNALRLCLPVSATEWRELFLSGKQDIHTEAGDVARAILSALAKDFGGFQAFTISGDWAEKSMSLKKARTLLGWEVRQKPMELSADEPAHFTLGQFWNDAPEPDLRPTTVSATFSDGRLHVSAELTDDDVFSDATAHNQRTWELGDAFEIFARRDDSEEYVEVHITPENIKLHLRFDDFGHTGRINDDISLVAADPDEITSTVERTPTGWRATASVPLDAGPGDLIRVSFCRYDASHGRTEPTLSSSSPHNLLRFHRPHEWQLCRIAPPRH
jgi:hypothetical protein